MWIADQWDKNDYAVLDCSGGEKLESWGGYVLRRPDPQVIWHTKRSHPMWKKANGIYHRSNKGGGSWEFHDLPEEWQIGYGTLSFRLKPFRFKHTGLFPEQAVNWDWCSSLIKKADRPVRALNLFAYTGGATCALLSAGAEVTHVDAAKGMVAWAKENAAISGLADKKARYLVDDCVKFVEREIRRGNTYDAILLDPPSYGRGPGKEVWKIEENVFDLLVLCSKLLSDDPLFVLINSYTTGLQPGVLSYMLHEAFDPVRKGHIEAGEIGLPVLSSNLVLPAGASGRLSFV